MEMFLGSLLVVDPTNAKNDPNHANTTAYSDFAKTDPNHDRDESWLPFLLK